MPTATLSSDLLTREQAATLLGVKSQTLAVWATAHEARAKYNIRFILQDWLDQHSIFFWIIFVVGILNDYNIAGCRGDARAERCALAPVDIVIKNSVDQRFDVALQQFSRPIA